MGSFCVFTKKLLPVSPQVLLAACFSVLSITFMVLAFISTCFRIRVRVLNHHRFSRVFVVVRGGSHDAELT